MSDKGLNDGVKRRALVPFLGAADRIPGLCVGLAVHKGLGKLAEGIDTSHSGFSEFSTWPKATLQKAVELSHFLALFLASLSRPGQNVLWFSDQDSIAANTERLTQLTKLVAVTCSDYLEFDLGNLRSGTTASDAPSHGLEDLVSIPDLVAGMLAECTALDPRPDPPDPEARWDAQRLSLKANAVVRWFFHGSGALKRRACILYQRKKMDTVVEFLNWAWARHQNPLSWYIRPLFILPFCYFAYRKSAWGMIVTVVAVASSMFWFPAPVTPDPRAATFLAVERQYIAGPLTPGKVAMTALVPVWFVALAWAFRQRSWLGGAIVIAAGTLLKIVWSFQVAGDSAWAIVAPVAVGTTLCAGVLLLAYTRIRRRPA